MDGQVVAVIVVLILVIIYFQMRKPACGCAEPKREKFGEAADAPQDDTAKDALPPTFEKNSDDALLALSQVRDGVDPSQDWIGTVASTELDPEIAQNHANFIKDVRNFTSTAGFTNVADDNTNPIFTNFRGLNRPQFVATGPDRRQVQDIDESVLKRNTYLRFGQGTSAPLSH